MPVLQDLSDIGERSLSDLIQRALIRHFDDADVVAVILIPLEDILAVGGGKSAVLDAEKLHDLRFVGHPLGLNADILFGERMGVDSLFMPAGEKLGYIAVVSPLVHTGKFDRHYDHIGGKIVLL